VTTDQILILAILAATVALFLWGRWRHDMVAFAALLACVAAGLVPHADTFAGFGHPAVITVACVLVLSRGLQTSGAVDVLTRVLLPATAGPLVSVAALTALGAVLSAFMNNVGALALLMPVALQIARKQDVPPGQVLMPLAFGSILGGMTTLIGTPPNLIVSGFRAEAGGAPFGMFDFSPVGVVVATVGVLFVVIFSRWLVPTRVRAGVESFDTGVYLTEARVREGSSAVGKTLHDLGRDLEPADAQVIGLIRNDVHVTVPHPGRVLYAGDILVIEAEPESLAEALSKSGLTLEEAVPAATSEATDDETDTAGPDANTAVDAPATDTSHTSDARKNAGSEVVLMELAVRPDALAVGRSASDIQLRTRFGINLLALSRQGRRSIRRLRSERVQAGDVLLMQGPPDSIMGFANEFGCVPLAERALRLPARREATLATAILGAAVAAAAFGLLPAATAFAAGVLVSMALRVISPRTVYDAVDWPIVVLLAALIPVAGAMATTGAADLMARLLMTHVAQGHAILSLALVLVVTMTLSDFMNNAATAAVMCPIALSVATQLDAQPDAFLMAVAIGASCAFLTPIGHQNNTLILGPGGFRFGDYWKLGLPLEIIVVATSVPLLLYFWPI